MAELRIQTSNGRRAFAPGEAIEGTAGWRVDYAKSATLRLLWRTEGKGSPDVKLEAETEFEQPGDIDDRAFRFVAPAGPWSFNGRLIAIVWTLELELKPGSHVETLDITIIPQL